MTQLSRRRFLWCGLGVAGLGVTMACGLVPPWQATRKVYRVARLTGASPNPEEQALVAVFRESLHDLGYVEGQNLTIDERYAGGNDRLAGPAAELVRQQPDVILVPSSVVVRALQAESMTIPIVIVGVGNVGASATLARPEDNVTGLSTPFLGGKHLQLLKEAVPALTRVSLLHDPSGLNRQPYEAAARAVDLEMRFVGAGTMDEVRAVFASGVGVRGDGLIVATGPALSTNQEVIAQLALEHGLPSIWQQNEAASRGGLLAYGPNRRDLFRRAAVYVDKILKGARPRDLPIEQPTVFDFAVNLKTARALGLTIPQSVLTQATDVIQ